MFSQSLLTIPSNYSVKPGSERTKIGDWDCYHNERVCFMFANARCCRKRSALVGNARLISSDLSVGLWERSLLSWVVGRSVSRFKSQCLLPNRLDPARPLFEALIIGIMFLNYVSIGLVATIGDSFSAFISQPSIRNPISQWQICPCAKQTGQKR